MKSITYISSCSPLGHFNFVDVVLSIGIPDRRSIFKEGLNESKISLGFNILRGCFHISANKAKSFICLFGDIINVLVPRKI